MYSATVDIDKQNHNKWFSKIFNKSVIFELTMYVYKYFHFI